MLNARRCLLQHWTRPRRPAIRVLPIWVVAAACGLGCASQASLQRDDVRPLPYAKHSGSKLVPVSGLRQALSQTGKPAVRVLVVHGMITNEPEYSQGLQGSIAEALRFVRAGPTLKLPVSRDYDAIVMFGPQPHDLPSSTTRSEQASRRAPETELRRTAWADPADPTSERLVFYEVLWSPLRDQIKNWFLGCFESRSVNRRDCPADPGARPNIDRRAAINGWIKDRVLVDGFADAMVVLSPLGDLLRDDVQLAMCLIAHDVMDGPREIAGSARKRCDVAALAHRHGAQAVGLALGRTPFFSITHSLGSFLVMDTQQRLALARASAQGGAGGGTGDEVLRETLLFFLTDQSTTFMLANQVSLLQLARLTAVCVPAREGQCPNRLLPDQNSVLKAPMPLAQMNTYVAFNDSNDLLGFELPPYISEAGIFGTLVNVSVRNDAFRLPGVFKDPRGTHTNHVTNRAVIDAIVDGIDLAGQ